MPLFSCRICGKSRSPFRALCAPCQTLFNVVQQNLGTTGFSELIDRLIATGIDKAHVKFFLEANPRGQGSILDQIIAQLTNNLAEGMGVKENEMSASDVRRIREEPIGVASHKPLNE